MEKKELYFAIAGFLIGMAVGWYIGDRMLAEEAKKEALKLQEQLKIKTIYFPGPELVVTTADPKNIPILAKRIEENNLLKARVIELAKELRDVLLDAYNNDKDAMGWAVRRAAILRSGVAPIMKVRPSGHDRDLIVRTKKCDYVYGSIHSSEYWKLSGLTTDDHDNIDISKERYLGVVLPNSGGRIIKTPMGKWETMDPNGLNVIISTIYDVYMKSSFFTYLSEWYTAEVTTLELKK